MNAGPYDLVLYFSSAFTNIEHSYSLIRDHQFYLYIGLDQMKFGYPTIVFLVRRILKYTPCLKSCRRSWIDSEKTTNLLYPLLLSYLCFTPVRNSPVYNSWFKPISLEGRGGGVVVKLTPLDFFGFKILLLDRLSKALAQLFLVCEHIFRH